MSGMTAAVALQAALVGALRMITNLEGVYADAPPRAAFPYARVECIQENAWGCSSHDGSEITARISIWDDEPSRLQALEQEVEEQLGRAILSDAQSWSLISLRLRQRESGLELVQPWSRRLLLQARLVKSRT